MVLKIILSALAILLLAFCVRLYMFGKQSQEMSPSLGLVDGQLMVCGDKPNCVSSSSKGSHFIEAIEYEGSFEEARKKVKGLSIGELKSESERYLYFLATSKIFKFVDDVEFYFPEGKNVIEVRSASRVGHSDMGANKKRVEKVRESFSKN